MSSRRRRAHSSALSTAGLFALVGLGWIVVTDSVVERTHVSSPAVFQTVKGALFVLAFASFVYAVLRIRDARQATRDDELAELFELMPLAIWRTDLDLRVHSAFGGAINDLDVPPGWPVGSTVQEVMGSGEHPAVKAHLRVLEGAPIATYVEQFQGRTYSGSVVPERDRRGNVVGLMGATADITEQLQTRQAVAVAQERLSEHESLWQAMVEQSLVGIAIIVDGRYSYANRHAREMLGYTLEELRGLSSILDVIAPEDRPVVAENMRARLSGDDAPPRYTIRVLRSDGSRIDIELFSSAVRYENQTALAAMFVDVSHRLAHERIQRESEQWFRSLIENGQDMVGVIDLQGRYVYVSPSVEHVLGYQPSEMVGRSPLEFVHEGDCERVTSELADLIHGSGSLATTLRFLDSSGQTRIIQVRGRKAVNPAGETIIIVNSSDVTEARRLERRFEESERLASLGRVASAMAHEFNNVLMAISPFAELLRGGALDEKQRRYADRIMQSIERGRNVTQDVLRYTRASQPAFKPLSATELFNGLSAELRGMLPSTIRLHTDVDPSLVLRADAHQLAQVVVNLSLNARDAMPAGGTLTIRAWPATAAELTNAGLEEGKEDYAHVTVADSGVGIPDDVMARMFEPMFTTKKATGGTGLGLSVVHEVVRTHNGTIFAESAIGEGTVFHLFIPRAREAVSVSETGPQEQAEVRIDRLLLVEDDDDVAAAVTETLHRRGLRPRRVTSAAAAIEITSREEFDVAIVDVGLPDLDGIKLVHTLRQMGHELAVVFVTGHADDVEFDGRVETRDIILRKPFDSERLMQALRAVA